MTRDEQTITEDTVRRRSHWRHIRTAITLLVLVVVVVAAAWYSWKNVTGSETSAESTAEPCTPTASAAPAPADIQLNVYNSTTRAGLASAVSTQMKERGFTITEVDNDPLDKSIAGTAEVRSHPDQQAAANLIVSMVPGAVYLPDERDSVAVDLVIGDAFEALAPAGEPAPPVSTLPPCSAPAG